MVETTQIRNLLDFTSGRARVAFPAYRVFVFGKEITNDVYEVRVNNSGGSMERSASTCSFSFVNPDNKYLFTYADMIIIGKLSQASKAKFKQAWNAYGLDSVTYADLFQGSYSSAGLLDFALSNVKDDTLIENDANLAKIYNDLADRFSKSGLDSSDLSNFDKDDFGRGSLKGAVLEKKLRYTPSIKTQFGSNLLHMEDRVISEYPMQQGDCIFHANDPVRIAFRDPFDPRIWYWQFTGFIDSWTENQGENKDSLITITCTDVTKMARYSFIQIGVGLQDPNIENIITQFKDQTISNKGVQYYKELFQGFTMLEVLETLFFGTDNSALASDDLLKRKINTMSSEAIDQYLANISADLLNPNSERYLADPDVRYNRVLEIERDQAKKVLDSAGSLAPICIPAPYMRNVSKLYAERGQYNASSATVVAQFSDKSLGVNAYFYGETDPIDLALGTQLTSLKQWNDLLHHRVRLQDIKDMGLNKSVNLKNHRELTSYDLVGIIGSDIEHYPVGYGRVFYLSRARFTSGELGRSIIDKSLGGSSGLFSIFKDKLSYIYDMAERVDFRFYATPKGDYVYEMPFYDFNPEDFDVIDLDALNYGVQTVHDILASQDEVPLSREDLAAIGFLPDLDLQEDVRNRANVEDFNYLPYFTIERDDQNGFSNTLTDQGVSTVFRCKPNVVKSLSSVNNLDLKSYQYVADKGAIPTLGMRVADADAWGFIDSEEDAEVYAAIMMARINAEAKNASVSTLPKFGLMVNRPLFWRERNYYANIVSLQHSIVWNSSADTTINMNSIRGWSGEVDPRTGYPLHRHFSGTDRPFSMATISQDSSDSQGG
jgi:hypothetical protein